jgi:signal transduction histidine kinase
MMPAGADSSASESETADALRASRDRLRRAQEAARLGTWDWDLRSGALVWDGVAAVHGIDEGSFGGSFEDYLRDMHPEDHERVLAAIQACRASGDDLDIEYRIILPDGGVRWVSGLGKVFYDDDGQPVRISGTCQDITERKRATDTLGFQAQAGQLLSSSLDYRATLQNLASLIVPFMADWAAIYLANGDAVERVSVAHSDPARAGLLEEYQRRFPPNPHLTAGPAAVVRTGQPIFFPQVAPAPASNVSQEQFDMLRRLGMQSVIVAPMQTRDRMIGAISFAMGDSGRTYTEADVELAMDIGRRAGLAVDNALLYEEARRVEAELRHANEQKDEFLGILAHEVRSPTTTLFGSARILHARWERLDKDTIDELTEGIEAGAARLSRLIDNLLVIARLELDRLEVPQETLDLPELIGKTVADFTRNRPDRNVEVKADELPPVQAGSTYIEQVVRNLVENADKYSPAGLPIEVAASSNADSVEVRVLDSGPGIAPEELNLIFNSFYRSSTTPRGVPGKGLGLTVCKRLIEAHGGSIWARNRPAGGLEVGFSLPIETHNA